MTCTHEVTELRERPTALGGVQYALQCVTCGMRVGNWVKKPAEHVPAWDMAAEEQAKTRGVSATKAAFDARRESESALWWRTYQRFMQSLTWKEKRQLVLQRAAHTCEACLTETAQQVHHTAYPKVTLTEGMTGVQFTTTLYAALVDQPLYELRAVCYPCHANQHPHMQRDAA